MKEIQMGGGKIHPTHCVWIGLQVYAVRGRAARIAV